MNQRRPPLLERAAFYALILFLVACLLPFVVGERRINLKFALLLINTTALEVVIENNTIGITTVAAMVTAFLGFALFAKHFPRKELAIGLILIGTYVYLGLTPFKLLDNSISFHWIPLFGALHGSRFVNAWVICYMIFLYGALVWLLLRRRRSFSFKNP